MVNAVIAAYTGIYRQNVENDSEKKPKTNPRIQFRNLRRPTQKQFETSLPDMWEGGTLSPRRLLQEYGYIGIQERSVS